MEETGNKLHLFVSAASSTSHNQNWWRMKFLCREMQQLPWFVDCIGIQAVLQPSPPQLTKISVLQCCHSKFPFQVPKYPHRSLSSAVLTSHSGVGSIFWFDPISCSSPASQSLPMHPLDCRACPWQNPVRLYLLRFLSASPLVLSNGATLPALSMKTTEPVECLPSPWLLSKSVSLSLQKNPSCSEILTKWVPLPRVLGPDLIEEGTAVTRGTLL